MIYTQRLLLRQWQQSDYLPFAQLNADPLVMEYFPRRLTRKLSDEVADKMQSLIATNGWGFWAVELRATNQFIGFVGLHSPQGLPCCPCVEVGWRLAKEHWGNGYATEAAKAALIYGFETLELEQIVAFTAVPNLRSQAVMLRLGMANTGNNFLHPTITHGHPLQEHVLYAIARQQMIVERNGSAK